MPITPSHAMLAIDSANEAIALLYDTKTRKVQSRISQNLARKIVRNTASCESGLTRFGGSRPIEKVFGRGSSPLGPAFETKRRSFQHSRPRLPTHNVFRVRRPGGGRCTVQPTPISCPNACLSNEAASKDCERQLTALELQNSRIREANHAANSCSVEAEIWSQEIILAPMPVPSIPS